MDLAADLGRLAAKAREWWRTDEHVRQGHLGCWRGEADGKTGVAWPGVGAAADAPHRDGGDFVIGALSARLGLLSRGTALCDAPSVAPRPPRGRDALALRTPWLPQAGLISAGTTTDITPLVSQRMSMLCIAPMSSTTPVAPSLSPDAIPDRKPRTHYRCRHDRVVPPTLVHRQRPAVFSDYRRNGGQSAETGMPMRPATSVFAPHPGRARSPGPPRRRPARPRPPRARS